MLPGPAVPGGRMVCSSLASYCSQSHRKRRTVLVGDPNIVKPSGLFRASYTSYRVTSVAVDAARRDVARRVSVRRRFSDFVVLHNSLAQRFQCVLLPAPAAFDAAAPLQSRSAADARRATRLQAFLESVLDHAFLCRDAVVRAFFDVDDAEWQPLRRAVSAARGSGDGRLAAQALSRAGAAAAGDDDADAEGRWRLLLYSDAPGRLDVEPAARAATVAPVEQSCARVAALTRRAHATGLAHARALTDLAAALASLAANEAEAFHGGVAPPAAAAGALVAAAAAMVAEASALARRADAVERFVGAPFSCEAAHIAALRDATQQLASMPMRTRAAQQARNALRVASARLPGRFAAAARRGCARYCAAAHTCGTDAAAAAAAGFAAITGRRDAKPPRGLAFDRRSRGDTPSADAPSSYALFSLGIAASTWDMPDESFARLFSAKDAPPARAGGPARKPTASSTPAPAPAPAPSSAPAPAPAASVSLSWLQGGAALIGCSDNASAPAAAPPPRPPVQLSKGGSSLPNTTRRPKLNHDGGDSNVEAVDGADGAEITARPPPPPEGRAAVPPNRASAPARLSEMVYVDSNADTLPRKSPEKRGPR
ncbi:hypothetical protein M885DRAFT_514341 [Pelagophyceae sp. CCMP2097]|nr:hypothetical protein M885DRAFT_514341 [Pelagophyceae sp. CCMP2097]